MERDELVYQVIWELICGTESNKQLDALGKLIAKETLPEHYKAKLRVSYATKLRNLNVVENLL